MILGHRARKALLAGLVVAGATSFLACGGILGFETFTLEPSDTGAVDGGGDAPVDGPDGDGDSGGDAGPSCADADLQTSVYHCGRCGHDCGGSTTTCRKGACEPLLLADGLRDPQGLVVDDANVFVAEHDADRIMRLDKIPPGDCSGSPLHRDCIFTETNALYPTALGIDANNVYWVDEHHAIRSCPRAGCGGQAPTQIVSSGDPVFQHQRDALHLPLELIVRDGEVFFPETYSGAVKSVNVATKVVTTYLAANSGDFSPVAIAVDDTHVFFTGDSNSVHAAEIIAVPRDASGTFRVVSNGAARSWGLGLAPSGTLYWTVPFVASFGTDGKVQAALKTDNDGTPLGDFAGAQDDPRALVVDAVNVYWLMSGSENQPTGKVVYCPQAGCPATGPVVLADGQRVPRHLTQDDKALYWSNAGLANGNSVDGQVWKVAKP